ncbi:MAG: phenylalanine--tRNA ligase subunit beta [Acholeplasma sp.]|jgi:phenylalanyl-tRNA synthetase beta chain|nr:MAG: phenylalanine--tRNA ligase subunit beta [Acholeplasma sp.]
MKILENVLKTFIDVPDNMLELTNQKIIEVESFGPINEATKLVIGKVLTCEDHPNSDHLHVTTVDLGDRIEQIVCGAPNVAKDQYVIVAQVGTVLPGNFQIKASKIRNVDSNGMICSLSELGFEEKVIPDLYKDGIFYFNEAKPLGTPALAHLAQDGWVMELKLTPNRGDLLSHLGFAYDLGSMTDQPVRLPDIQIEELGNKNPYQVKIETEGCGLYYARYFEHVTIKESPWWLKSALLASDINPINNVVDISNYVLIEYGTPLHMFDAAKLKSKTIVIRDAYPKEKVVTLDEVERELIKDDVCITSHDEVIAVGGVMGLESTMIDEKTTSVLLEAAYFDPKRIQKTSKRLNLRSDSSLRFERGVDPSRVKLGLERATQLLIELADAKVAKGIAEAKNHPYENPWVNIKKDYFNQALGVMIAEEELLSYFDRYRYEVKVEKDSYVLRAPSYRNDLIIEADFLEEVARMYGLDRIPMKSVDKPLPGKLTFKQKRLRHLRHHLSNLGLYEVITYSLLAPEEVHRYNKLGTPVSVLMPLSEDKKTLRQSLVHGLLEVISYNQSRQQESVAIFEMGNCFAEDLEELHLGIALSGPWHQNLWKKEKVTPDFYTVKGILDTLFEPLGISLTYQMSQAVQDFHPYKQATILYQNQILGVIAEVHPSHTKDLDIAPTVLAEISLMPLLEEGPLMSYQPISKFPSITRDLAVIVNEEILASDLLLMIKQTAKKVLVKANIFDIYQGSSIEKGKKSLAFSLVFNDSEKTLTADDIDQIMKKIINRLNFSYQAIVRS